MLAGNILIWSSGSFFKFILVIGRIHSLTLIGLKSRFLAVSASKSWGLLLAPGGHSQVQRGCLEGRKYASLADSSVPVIEFLSGDNSSIVIIFLRPCELV